MKALLAVALQQVRLGKPGLKPGLDRARLEDREATGVVVDDRGNAASRVDREVPVLLLLARRQVQHADLIGDAQFLEGNRNLLAVWRLGCVQLDHVLVRAMQVAL
jgi:hypothetical protein